MTINKSNNSHERETEKYSVNRKRHTEAELDQHIDRIEDLAVSFFKDMQSNSSTFMFSSLRQHIFDILEASAVAIHLLDNCKIYISGDDDENYIDTINSTTKVSDFFDAPGLYMLITSMLNSIIDSNGHYIIPISEENSDTCYEVISFEGDAS